MALRRWSRWAARAAQVIGLACIFTSWSLVWQAGGDGDPTFTALRACELAFTAGGLGALSLVFGGRRGGVALLLLASVSFPLAIVRLATLG